MRGEIYWKLLQVDEAARGFIGWAQHRVRALVQQGVRTFAKTWVVEAVTVRVHAVEIDPRRGDVVAKLWLLKAAADDAVYELGSLTPTMYLNKLTLSPAFAGGARQNFTAQEIHRAVMEDAKVSRAQAYTWAAGVFVTFESTLFSPLANHLEDHEVADVYTVAVPASPRKFDFERSLAWYSVSSFANHRGVLWLAADMDKAVNGYVSTFHLALVDGKVPDGDQSFNLPMAGGRFSVTVTVSFEHSAITSVDTSSARKGQWELQLVSTDLTIAGNPPSGTLTITYTQTVNGSNAVLIAETMAVAVPERVESTTPPSFFQQEREDGVIQDITVPSTSFIEDYVVTEYPITPAVSTAPFLIGFIRHSVSQQTLSGILVQEGNGGFGHIPYSVALNVAESEALAEMYSDGTKQQVADPVVGFVRSSTSPWTPAAPKDFDIIGANVPRYDYTYPSGIFDLRRMAFSENDLALGYEVKRFESSIQPGTYERIEIRTLGGTVLRSGYRPMTQLPSGIVGIQNSTTTTTDSSGAWTQTGTYTTRVHTFTTSPPFVLYDAMVSVNEHIFTLAKMSKENGIGAESVLAIVPPGWAAALAGYRITQAAASAADTWSSYQDIIEALEDFIDEEAHPTRWLKDDDDQLPHELTDARNRILAIIEVCKFLKTAVVDPDEGGAHALGYIDTLMGFFEAYADANADPDFPEWVEELRTQYTKTPAPRATPLTAAEFARLFTGYLSVHMRIVSNPFNVPYATILCLGAGSWLWGTD